MKKFLFSFVLLSLLIILFEVIFANYSLVIIPEIFAAVIISLIYSRWVDFRRWFFYKFHKYNLPPESLGKLRISYAYLLRVRVDNRYLLVKGKYNKYQPPGGVYHYFDNVIERNYGFERDNTHGDEKDIRGTIEYKYLRSFLQWVKNGENRETGFNREFQEELIQSNILDKELFSNIEGEFICRKFKGIEFSDHHQIYELLIFDIYDIKLDHIQKEYLKNLQNYIDDRYVIVSSEVIKSRGVSENQFVETITNHTRYIL